MYILVLVERYIRTIVSSLLLIIMNANRNPISRKQDSDDPSSASYLINDKEWIGVVIAKAKHTLNV